MTLESGPWVAAGELCQTPRAVFIDARARTGAPDAYRRGHLVGAFYADLENDLSAPTPDAAAGGRHPLPPLDDWYGTMSTWGVTPERNVLIYDDAGGGMAAARVWWMLRAAGHTRTLVIDGGWGAIVAYGLPIEVGDGPRTHATVDPYPRIVNEWPTIEQHEVANRAPKTVLLDARAAERYRGEVEPIDPVAGHIPGAVNLPWQTLVQDGRTLPVDALRARFDAILDGADPSSVICSCGSGVTACHLLLAMETAGFSGAKLYVGSWSEWCRSGRPLGSSI